MFIVIDASLWGACSIPRTPHFFHYISFVVEVKSGATFPPFPLPNLFYFILFTLDICVWG